ncbi:MAG: CCA tRNA nucleotidyltransferase [Ktedonobacteraceae bacterium]
MDAFTLLLLELAAQFFVENKAQAYLTGGSVRNILLQRPCTDWDIVTTGDAPALSRKLATRMRGYYAHMHEKASRITVRHKEQDIVFDVAPLRGRTIEADLRQRDFTVNAIASPLPGAVRSFIENTSLPLIDPLSGAADLAARTLKVVNDDVFKQDTLRLLRAIRFATHYTLTIEERTQQLMREHASLLLIAAPERLHAELYAMLRPEDATECLYMLDNYGLLTALFPEFIPARGMMQPGLHHWDVFEHSLQTVAALERLATLLALSPNEMTETAIDAGRDDLLAIQALLHEAEQQGYFQYASITFPVMKLAALLHDVGKTTTQVIHEDGRITFYGHPQAGVPLVQSIARRLSLSTQDQRLIRQIVANHMRPGQLSHDTITSRAVRRYFVDLGPVGIPVALVSLADHLAMRGTEPLTDAWGHHLATVRLLLTRYIREREVTLPPHLVQPEELMRKFSLEPGPIIGQLLEQIAEARADGIVQSKDDAFWFVQEKLEQHT